MLSQNLTGRDANRGACTQPCRWTYTVVEEKRPNEPYPIEQNDLGTFIMSSKDMCTIELIPQLVEAGISSFKIEGRMKSAYYTAVVTNAYRMAMDAYAADPAGYRFDPAWLRELESVSHRQYDTGFYFNSPLEDPKLCDEPGHLREKAYFASALEPSEGTVPAALAGRDGVGYFMQRNKVSVGDMAEVISPGRVGRAFRVEELYGEDGYVRLEGKRVFKCTKATEGALVEVEVGAAQPAPIEQFLTGKPLGGCGMEEARALTKMMELAYAGEIR
jgi:putative protease